MIKQRHVWALEDEDGVFEYYDGGGITRVALTFMNRDDARYECDRGQRVVKYVPENKALVKAARKALEILSETSLFPCEEWILGSLRKALEVKCLTSIT